MQTPQHWRARNPPGQEQLLLNQGQGQPRGQLGSVALHGLLWGQGLKGALGAGILRQKERGWFGEVYFGSWDDAKLSGKEKIDEAAVRVCLWPAGL